MFPFFQGFFIIKMFFKKKENKIEELQLRFVIPTLTY